MRSEFVQAELYLAELIAHTRNSPASYSPPPFHDSESPDPPNPTPTSTLWNTYAARITFLHGQLAHSLGRTDRALECYRVAAWLSRKRKAREQDEEGAEEGVEDVWINAAARVGEVWVRVGVLRKEAAARAVASKSASGIVKEEMEGMVEWADLKEEDEELRRMMEEVGRICAGLGATLRSVAALVRACLTDEFLKAK